MKAQIMKRAWEIAKKAVAEFGGNAKSYFAEALRMAWAETKKRYSMDTLRLKSVLIDILSVFGKDMERREFIFNFPADGQMDILIAIGRMKS